MFNSLKIINKAFDYLEEEEKKINYEYEPHFEKEDDTWKRHLFFFELKKDFIKDVTEFGFCPYIQKPCREQRNDKNIMRFQKVDNFVRTDYIKNLYKKITSNTLKPIIKQKSISPQKSKYTFILKKNKSMKDISYNNKSNNKNTFLSRIYTKLKNREIEINILKNNKNLNSNKILKKNIENNDIVVYKKTNKNEEGQVEAESFIYEPEKSNIRYNNYYKSNNNDNYEDYNKEESLSNKINNNNNALSSNNKSTSYDMRNIENKRKGWKMTTSLEGVKYYRNLKSSFPLHEYLNNNKQFNGTFFRENKIKAKTSKFKEDKLKKSFSNIKLKNKSGKINKSNICYKKITSQNKKKSNNKMYKLFFHLRKLKNDDKNE
jgi:hypothetical protein